MNFRNSKNIRKTILEMSYYGKSAHVGSSLSCVEILNAIFALRESHPSFGSGKIILSKGHAAMALYAVAAEFGEIEGDFRKNYLKDASSLWGHPSMNPELAFIHWSTGSLGHGLPVMVGFAYETQELRNVASKHVVVLSDGELNEGTNWEALLFAGHHKLKNLLAVVDYNKIQSFGFCNEVIGLEPLKSKFEAFGWECDEVNGHNLEEISQSLTCQLGDKPKIVIAHTIKGKGVAEYEGRLDSHYKPVNEMIFKGHCE